MDSGAKKATGKEDEMRAKALIVALFGVGMLLGGCMQSTIEPASEASMTPRDKKLLAAAPYEKATIAEPYRRHIVDYHRKELPGTIVIDSDARYLYLVQDGGKAIRYGVTVGEEALAFTGIAKVGRKTEWPDQVKWVEVADDYMRELGVACEVVFGLKTSVFTDVGAAAASYFADIVISVWANTP